MKNPRCSGKLENRNINSTTITFLEHAYDTKISSQQRLSMQFGFQSMEYRLWFGTVKEHYL